MGRQPDGLIRIPPLCGGIQHPNIPSVRLDRTDSAEVFEGDPRGNFFQKVSPCVLDLKSDSTGGRVTKTSGRAAVEWCRLTFSRAYSIMKAVKGCRQQRSTEGEPRVHWFFFGCGAAGTRTPRGAGRPRVPGTAADECRRGCANAIPPVMNAPSGCARTRFPKRRAAGDLPPAARAAFPNFAGKRGNRKEQVHPCTSTTHPFIRSAR